MKTFANSLVALWQQLGLNQRVSLVVAALGVTAGLIAVMLWSKRPDYQLLYARMGDKDAASVISYLQSQNIPHQVTAGAAFEGQALDARLALLNVRAPTGKGHHHTRTGNVVRVRGIVQTQRELL